MRYAAALIVCVCAAAARADECDDFIATYGKPEKVSFEPPGQQSHRTYKILVYQREDVLAFFLPDAMPEAKPPYTKWRYITSFTFQQVNGREVTLTRADVDQRLSGRRQDPPGTVYKKTAAGIVYAVKPSAGRKATLQPGETLGTDACSYFTLMYGDPGGGSKPAQGDQPAFKWLLYKAPQVKVVFKQVDGTEDEWTLYRFGGPEENISPAAAAKRLEPLARYIALPDPDAKPLPPPRTSWAMVPMPAGYMRLNSFPGGPVHVRGYYNRYGTYVHPYTRSLPRR